MQGSKDFLDHFGFVQCLVNGECLLSEKVERLRLYENAWPLFYYRMFGKKEIVVSVKQRRKKMPVGYETRLSSEDFEDTSLCLGFN